MLTLFFPASSALLCTVWFVRAQERELVGHTDIITGLESISSMGFLLSCSLDASVRMYDLQGGIEKNRFIGHRSDNKQRQRETGTHNQVGTDRATALCLEQIDSPELFPSHGHCSLLFSALPCVSPCGCAALVWSPLRIPTSIVFC